MLTNARKAAKAWIGGFGAAVTAYLGTWTDDPRVLGLAALVTAGATWLVPNASPLQPVPSESSEGA